MVMLPEVEINKKNLTNQPTKKNQQKSPSKKERKEKSCGQTVSNSVLHLPNHLHMGNAYAELLFVF